MVPPFLDVQYRTTLAWLQGEIWNGIKVTRMQHMRVQLPIHKRPHTQNLKHTHIYIYIIYLYIYIYIYTYIYIYIHTLSFQTPKNDGFNWKHRVYTLFPSKTPGFHPKPWVSCHPAARQGLNALSLGLTRTTWRKPKKHEAA